MSDVSKIKASYLVWHFEYNSGFLLNRWWWSL